MKHWVHPDVMAAVDKFEAQVREHEAARLRFEIASEVLEPLGPFAATPPHFPAVERSSLLYYIAAHSELSTNPNMPKFVAADSSPLELAVLTLVETVFGAVCGYIGLVSVEQAVDAVRATARDEALEDVPV